MLIGGCAPIDIATFVDDDRAAVKDGQLLIDESSDTSRRFRCGHKILKCFSVVFARTLVGSHFLVVLYLIGNSLLRIREDDCMLHHRSEHSAQ